MVDAVATRTAPSALVLLQNAPAPSLPAEDDRSPSPIATAPAAPEQDDAVILDLSERAQAVLAQPNTAVPRPDAQAEKLAGLIRFEERFKLMTEYTALQQELAWLSDRTAAYALDKTFGGASADEGQNSDEASERAEIDRDIQRREELMPRFADLTRMLRALPGQES